MPLGSFDRNANLTLLTQGTYDVVVIGGGITGAGVALDAASRGLRTALIERDDFASGTSSKSSKMIHGGLRYLQNGDVRLVYEALRERQRLLRNAPHLVRVLPFLIPIFSGRDGIIPRQVARALGWAMWAYDLTGGLRIGKMHRRLKRAAALEHVPTLRHDRLAWAYLYYDAQADDARLTLNLARTAALDHGAVVVNHAAVTGFEKSSGPDGRTRISGVRVDADGSELTIRATCVVNAAGVWSDDVRAWDEGTHPESIRPAKGIHITVPWHKVRNDIAAVLPVREDKRSIFVVPWPGPDGKLGGDGGFTYVGTTDTDYDGDVDNPQCTPEDVDYLLRALNTSLDETFDRSDVLGAWAGLRPLVRTPDEGTGHATADLSRRHQVATSDDGLISVTGGKLTTYREMAQDTVDTVVRQLDTTDGPGRPLRRSQTARLRLRGATGWQKVAGRDPHLAERYGGEASIIDAMVEGEPQLGAPLVPGLPYRRAEALYAVRYEMATTLDDVLSRRTRAHLLARDATAEAAADIAELIGEELGWSPAERAAQVAAYRNAAQEERRSADLPAVSPPSPVAPHSVPTEPR